MASITKFTMSSALNHLRHIERKIAHPSNKDIDPSRSAENYSLISHPGQTSYGYLRERISQLYYYHRSDVKVMCGWVITAPKDLPVAEEENFFQLCCDFLCNRYGQENAVQAVVHKDEAGQSHIHFYFIPVIEDKKHGGEKVCCNDVINKLELKTFHPDLQNFLSSHGCSASVHTGITAANGRNYTVAELKADLLHTHEVEEDRWHTQTRNTDIDEDRGRW